MRPRFRRKDLTTRQRRQLSIRRRVKGTPERPRLAVFRSLRYISAQVVDDSSGQVLVSATTAGTSLDISGSRVNVEAAKKVGQAVAEAAKAKNIEQVVFDRGGYRYHGRVKALADAAREAGLQF
jgi:large subunit ribosomal protein L18